MFSEVSVILFTEGGGTWQGACMAGASMYGRGCVHGRGMCVAGKHVWQGVCVAGGVHGGGHVWQGVCGRRHGGGMCAGGMYGRGAYVAGEMATAADGTHPTEMHSC